MKILPLLSAGVFATITMLSFSVQAADADPAPATETQTGKAPAKKVKPHSHMEEKTGMSMPQSATEAKSDKAVVPESQGGKVKADKDRSKHYHPRDGK